MLWRQDRAAERAIATQLSTGDLSSTGEPWQDFFEFDAMSTCSRGSKFNYVGTTAHVQITF